mgnify:CR=1 FL=1
MVQYLFLDQTYHFHLHYQVANNYDVEILKYELASELHKTKIPQIKSVEEIINFFKE